MITTLIVDDEAKHRGTMEKMLTNFCPDVSIIGKASSVEEAISIINDNNPDLVFLDVEMPGGNGFTLLEHFEEPSFDVVFATAHDLYAINAIKFAALDYILKPINIKELQEAVHKCALRKENKEPQQQLSEKFEVFKSNSTSKEVPKKIALPTSDGIDFINSDEIVRCEADRSYSTYFTIDGKKIIVSKPLKEYESLLEQCNFFRVHKSHMINLNHITKYVKGKGGYVIMDDGSEVDVSVRRKEHFLSRLSN